MLVDNVTTMPFGFMYLFIHIQRDTVFYVKHYYSKADLCKRQRWNDVSPFTTIDAGGS